MKKAPRPFYLLCIALVFMTSSCEKPRKGYQFDFCKEIMENECIPPLLRTSVVYTFPNARKTKTNRDYFNDIYFAGDALAFQLLFPRKLSDTEFEQMKKELSGNFRFSDKEEYPLERIDVRRSSAVGLTLVGSILEKKYESSLQEPWKKALPVKVTYEIFRNTRRIASQTITIEIQP